MYELPSTEQVVKYLHAALGFPTKSTMLNAVSKNWLVGWPGLTVESVNKSFPEFNATQKGHMKQQRQGVRSMKAQEANIESNVPETQSNPPEPKTRHNDV